MKNIKIIAFLCFCCVWNFCLGQEASVSLDVSLNIREGLKFANHDQTGINRKGGTGKIKVEVYDKRLYLEEHNFGSNSFMYGFKSIGNSNGNYDNVPFAVNQRHHWYCYGSSLCSPFADSSDAYYIYDNSNNLKLFKKALHAVERYTANSSAGWHTIGTGSMDVVVRVSFYNDAKLDDIISIKIPGVSELTKQDFGLNSGDLRIEVYRGSSTPEHIYTQDDNIVVYEGDSVVFKSLSDFGNIKGLTDLAIQRYAGESIFMSNAIKKGAYKPFLFYDSNVHGVKMRPYPKSWNGSRHRYPGLSYTDGEYSLSWIANTRRDYLVPSATDLTNISLSGYKNQNDFDLGNLSGFPNKNKFSKNTEFLEKQRNNQKEGLNIEIINAYIDDKLGVAGLDPDELIYKNWPQSKIANENIPNGADFTYVTGDEWKKIEPSHNGHINYSLKENLNKIGRFLDTGKYYDYELSEIMDENLYIYKTNSQNIEGKVFDWRLNQPMFNNKRPIVYSPRAENKPILHSRSSIEWIPKGGNSGNDINIAVLSPLEGNGNNVDYDKLTNWQRKNPAVNFYGLIEGPTFVARHQKNVSYSVTNLPNLNDVPGKFELVFTYENSNGFLETQRRHVYNGNSTLTVSDFGGGGYHEITLQYTRSKTEGTPVIIAGKELVEVDLRFIFAPNQESDDFSNNPEHIFLATATSSFSGKVRLSEQKGNGNKWFLSSQSERMQEKTSDGLVYGLKHGYEDPNVIRTYVLSEQESVTLSVLDSDPHSFIHYEPDWYVSERRLSKRPIDLDDVSGYSYIKWYAAKDIDFTTDVKTLVNIKGKHCLIDPSAIYSNYHDAFYVKAEFNDTSKIIVKIVVRQTANHIQDIINIDDQNIGVVKAYPLNDNQFDVLKLLKNVSTRTKQDFKILAVQDIFSTYAYGAVDLQGATSRAPRYKVDGIEVGEHKRFSPQNNFDARFDWKFSNIDKDNLVFTRFNNKTDPTLANWFPETWIRHLDGTPQSPEIPNFSDSNYIKAFNEEYNPVIENLNINDGNLYERWQVRLPWIAQTGVHGYKTRWNIKTIFDINKMFNRRNIPTGFRRSGATASSYHMAVNGTDGSKIIPDYDGDAREKQEFFQHLKSGRMVILKSYNFGSEPSELQVAVYNNPPLTTPLGTEIFDGLVQLNTEGHQFKTTLKKEKIASETSTLSVYPNSSKNGIFNVRISSKEGSTINVELFNALAQRLYNNQPSKNKSEHHIRVGEGLNLKTGVYVLKVSINGKTQNKKLIVE